MLENPYQPPHTPNEHQPLHATKRPTSWLTRPWVLHAVGVLCLLSAILLIRGLLPQAWLKYGLFEILLVIANLLMLFGLLADRRRAH